MCVISMMGSGDGSRSNSNLCWTGGKAEKFTPLLVATVKLSAFYSRSKSS